MGFVNGLLNVCIRGRHAREIDRDPRWSSAQRFQHLHQEPKYDEEDRLAAIARKEEAEAEAARLRSTLF